MRMPHIPHQRVLAEQLQALYWALEANPRAVYFARKEDEFHDGLTSDRVILPSFQLLIMIAGLGQCIAGTDPTDLRGKRKINLTLHASGAVMYQPSDEPSPFKWTFLPGGLFAYVPALYLQERTWEHLLPTQQYAPAK